MSLNDGLIEFWTFDSNGNGSLSSYNFTVNGATNAACKINKGYIGDGVDDYLEMASLGVTPKSFAIWYKPGAEITTSTNARSLLHFDSASAYRYVYLGKASGSISNELITINPTNSSNSLFYWNTSQIGVSSITTDFHLIIIVWESASSNYRLYYDNVNCGLASTYLSPVQMSSWNNSRLLRYSSSYYADSVDAFGVWSVSLTSSDASSLWNNGNGSQYPFDVEFTSIALTADPLVVRPNETVSFTCATEGGNPPITYAWNFKDGDTSTDQNPSHSFSTVGVYEVSCTASDDDTDTISDIVSVEVKLPSKSTGGGSYLAQSWLLFVDSVISGAAQLKYVEMTNRMILDYVFTSPHQQITGDFMAYVVKVHDGDTVTLMTDFRGFAFPLRLANIDAAELSEGGDVARDWLAARVLGQKVMIYVDPRNRTGKYGRLIGEIFVNGLNVNDEMVAIGLVQPFGRKNESHVPSFDYYMKKAGVSF